ncbi:Hypothetical predicted protein, partial [Marmota monax]
ESSGGSLSRYTHGLRVSSNPSPQVPGPMVPPHRTVLPVRVQKDREVSGATPLPVSSPAASRRFRVPVSYRYCKHLWCPGPGWLRVSRGARLRVTRTRRRRTASDSRCCGMVLQDDDGVGCPTLGPHSTPGSRISRPQTDVRNEDDWCGVRVVPGEVSGSRMYRRRLLGSVRDDSRMTYEYRPEGLANPHRGRSCSSVGGPPPPTLSGRLPPVTVSTGDPFWDGSRVWTDYGVSSSHGPSVTTFDGNSAPPLTGFSSLVPRAESGRPRGWRGGPPSGSFRVPTVCGPPGPFGEWGLQVSEVRRVSVYHSGLASTPSVPGPWGGTGTGGAPQSPQGNGDLTRQTLYPTFATASLGSSLGGSARLSSGPLERQCGLAAGFGCRGTDVSGCWLPASGLDLRVRPGWPPQTPGAGWGLGQLDLPQLQQKSRGHWDWPAWARCPSLRTVVHGSRRVEPSTDWGGEGPGKGVKGGAERTEPKPGVSLKLHCPGWTKPLSGP